MAAAAEQQQQQQQQQQQHCCRESSRTHRHLLLQRGFFGTWTLTLQFAAGFSAADLGPR
jgi:hypothetical protein